MDLYAKEPAAIAALAEDVPRMIGVYLSPNIRAAMRVAPHATGDYSAAARAAIVDLLVDPKGDARTRQWLQQRERSGRPSTRAQAQEASRIERTGERLMLTTRDERALLRKALSCYLTYNNLAGDDDEVAADLEVHTLLARLA